MNKFIYEQLKKTKILLPEFDENTTELLIRKTSGTINLDELVVGKDYKIFIEDYIINEPETFTLSANWNNGTKPKSNKVVARVIQLMGKMVKVSTVDAENNYWDGWLPRKSFKILDVRDE